MLPQNSIKRVYMTKFIIRETRVQGTWLSGSKSRCSISSTEKVVEVEEKKRKRLKIGAIFKSIGKWLPKVADVIIAIGSIAGLITFILSFFV